jgi:hypothetical protein
MQDACSPTRIGDGAVARHRDGIGGQLAHDRNAYPPCKSLTRGLPASSKTGHFSSGLV